MTFHQTSLWLKSAPALLLAAGYSPSFIRHPKLYFSRAGREKANVSRSSLASQGDEQVAVVTLQSSGFKSHILNHRGELGDWHVDDRFRGLTVLQSPADHEIDVCAIHGLGGNAFDTWTSATTMWLRDLLPSSAPFDQSRIITFGFNAGLTDRSASVGVRHWAIEFLNQISLIRSPGRDCRKPLIVVCHSLGGLVGREAMIGRGNFPGQYANVSLSQCGLLFLGTPHSGTREADWNEGFLAIAELAFGVRSRDIVDKLRAFNDPSVASKEAFAALKPLPPYFCFCEGKNTKVLGSYRKVVSQDSASLNGTTAVAITEADHNEICKFERKNSAYLLVRDRLASLRQMLLAGSTEIYENVVSGRQESTGTQSDRLSEGMHARGVASNTTIAANFGAVIASGQANIHQVGNSQNYIFR